MRKIKEMSASELIALLTDAQKDELYRMLWSDHVREDVEAAMEDYSGSLPDNENEREALVESVVNAYVYDGRYDCNLSYWDNINNLLDDYSTCVKELWRNGDYYVDENGVGHIPDGVTKVKKEAFFGCADLIRVVIPDSVVEIGVGAFSCCSELIDVTIPNGVTKIGGFAFCNCIRLKNLKLPSSLVEIDEFAFFNHGILERLVNTSCE